MRLIPTVSAFLLFLFGCATQDPNPVTAPDPVPWASAGHPEALLVDSGDRPYDETGADGLEIDLRRISIEFQPRVEVPAFFRHFWTLSMLSECGMSSRIDPRELAVLAHLLFVEQPPASYQGAYQELSVSPFGTGGSALVLQNQQFALPDGVGPLLPSPDGLLYVVTNVLLDSAGIPRPGITALNEPNRERLVFEFVVFPDRPPMPVEWWVEIAYDERESDTTDGNRGLEPNAYRMILTAPDAYTVHPDDFVSPGENPAAEVSTAAVEDETAYLRALYFCRIGALGLAFDQIPHLSDRDARFIETLAGSLAVTTAADDAEFRRTE